MFKVILDYIGSSRPTRATGDFISKTKQPVGRNKGAGLGSTYQSYPRRPENFTLPPPPAPCDSGFLVQATTIRALNCTFYVQPC